MQDNRVYTLEQTLREDLHTRCTPTPTPVGPPPASVPHTALGSKVLGGHAAVALGLYQASR